MSEQYTPTTDDVRLEYMAVRWGKNDTVSFEARAEFDRWLAAHDAEVAAKAVSDALVSVRAERDAALARIAELEEKLEIGKHLALGNMQLERDRALEAEARIAGAAKLHRKDHTALGNPICNTCGTPYPCPTRRRLGLNEGELA